MKLRLFCSVLMVLSLTGFAAPSILVETESFETYGGWGLDTQFMDQMGSPYLLAHGVGNPVGNAVTAVDCAEASEYRVWVRTFDWVARWRGEEWAGRKQAKGQAPGRFSILINDKAIEGTFETGVPEDVKRLKLIQAETGMQGEIVGKAAAICIEHNASPRDVYKVHLDKLKALMEE